MVMKPLSPPKALLSLIAYAKVHPGSNNGRHGKRCRHVIGALRVAGRTFSANFR
jgi:hypothetical protein